MARKSIYLTLTAIDMDAAKIIPALEQVLKERGLSDNFIDHRHKETANKNFSENLNAGRDSLHFFYEQWKFVDYGVNPDADADYSPHFDSTELHLIYETFRPYDGEIRNVVTYITNECQDYWQKQQP